MTTLAPSTLGSSIDPNRPKRPRWLIVTIAVVVLAVIGAGIGWLVYIHTYQPLRSDGGVTGLGTPKTLKPITDGVASQTYDIVVGPRGTVAVGDYSIRNTGHFAVRLLGLNGATNFEDVTRIQWGPLSHVPVGPSAPAIAALSQARNFPVTLQPGDAVVLHVTVTEPKCYLRNHTTHVVDDIPIRWSALGVHHVWDFTMVPAGDNVPILLCPPAAALSRTVRS